MTQIKRAIILYFALTLTTNAVTDAKDHPNLIKNFLKVSPFIDLSQIEGISEKCQQDFLYLKSSMENVQLWALKIYDASAKLPSGLLNGNVNQYGDFDQCLHAIAPEQKFQGKYCLAYLQPLVDPQNQTLESLRKLAQSNDVIKSNFEDPGHIAPRFSTIHWGVCMPSTCTHEDLELGLKSVVGNFIRNTELNFRIKVDEKMCYVKDQDWTTNIPKGTKLAILFFMIILLITLLSTIYDCNDTIAENSKNSWLTAFSLKNNWNQLTSVKENPGEIKSVHGLRAIIVTLIVLGHRGEVMVFNAFFNRTEMSHKVGEPISLISRGSVLFTDGFLLLSGMLTAYSFIGRYTRGQKLNFFTEFAGRYMRLMPPIAALAIFTSQIFHLIGSGPQWNIIVTPQSELCQQNWWLNFLLIQNFFGFENICLTHTHYVATDFQLFVITPIVAYVIWKYPKKGSLAIIGLIIVSNIGRFFVTHATRISDFMYYGIYIRDLYKTADFMYILPIFRFGSYGIGIFLGYILRVHKTVQLTSAQIKFGWLATIILLLTSLFGPLKMCSIDYIHDPLDSAWFAALAPIAWCLGFSWIIFIAENGHKNFFINFLEWRGFVLVTRLSYSIYLTQYTVFYYNIGSKRAPEHFEILRYLVNLPETFWIIFTSILLTLFIEFPFCNLKKLLLDNKPSKIPNKVQ